MKHKVYEYIKNPVHPITIDLVGCGGTGSLVLTRLARMNFALKKLNHPGIHVTVYDDDIVESHNIGRQNFTEDDLFQNKAFCLVEKCNIAYGTDWYSYSEKHHGNFNSNILISCVDNVLFRKHLFHNSANPNKAYQPYEKPYYWLDCGNGKDFGQVVLGDPYDYKNGLKSIFRIFNDMEKYESVEFQGIESCGYADSLEVQDLFINDIIACHACELIWKLFRQEHLEYHGVIINQEKLICKPLKI